jgi:hypothetical protein
VRPSFRPVEYHDSTLPTFAERLWLKRRKIQHSPIFWYVTLCRWVNIFRRFDGQQCFRLQCNFIWFEDLIAVWVYRSGYADGSSLLECYAVLPTCRSIVVRRTCREYNPSKLRELLTHWHSVTYQKDWNFSFTCMRTSVRWLRNYHTKCILWKIPRYLSIYVVTLFYVMSRYVMLCHFMSCYVMSYYVMLSNVTF